MTKPDRNEPRDLDELITDMEATLKQLKDRQAADRAAAEDQKANIEAARRRRGIGLVPGLAAAVILGRKALTHPVGAAVTSTAAAATIAVAATLAVTHEPAPRVPPRITAPAQPSASRMSGGGPPDDEQPTPTDVSPSGEHPPPTTPGSTPPGNRDGTHKRRPGQPSGDRSSDTTPPHESAGPPSVSSTRQCRVYLPKLGICLLPAPNQNTPLPS